MKRGLQCAVGGLFFSVLLSGYECAGKDIKIINDSASVAETAMIYAQGEKNKPEISMKERMDGPKKDKKWPGYMEWMVDVKKGFDGFEGYINSFSSSISKEDENLLYIDLNAGSKSAKFYIYQKKF